MTAFIKPDNFFHIMAKRALDYLIQEFEYIYNNELINMS
jgi:hypothetical protein